MLKNFSPAECSTNSLWSWWWMSLLETKEKNEEKYLLTKAREKTKGNFAWNVNTIAYIMPCCLVRRSSNIIKVLRNFDDNEHATLTETRPNGTCGMSFENSRNSISQQKICESLRLVVDADHRKSFQHYPYSISHNSICVLHHHSPHIW